MDGAQDRVRCQTCTGISVKPARWVVASGEELREGIDRAVSVLAGFIIAAARRAGAAPILGGPPAKWLASPPAASEAAV